MERLPKKENDPLKRLINPSLLDDAPTNLAEQVLRKISAATSSYRNYKPVISKPVWWSIASLCLMLVAAALLIPGGSESFSIYGKELTKPNFELPNINWMPFEFSINSGLILALLLSVLAVLSFDKYIKKLISN